MAGLSRRSYWAITWLYCLLLYLGEIALVLVVGIAFRFPALITHSAALIVVLFVLYAAHITSYACFLSTLFTNRWAALVCSFFLHIFMFTVGWQTADRATGYETSSSGAQFFINLMPTFALSHAAELLTHAGVGDITERNQRALGFDNIGGDTPHPIGLILCSMLFGSLVFIALGLYLDAGECLLMAPDGP